MTKTYAESPTQLHELFAEHLNAGDIDSLAGLYETSAVLVMPDGERATGSRIRRALSDFIAAKPELRILRSRVTQEDDLALLSNDWQLTLDGEATEGTGTEVARRQADGSWLYAIDDAASSTTLGLTPAT